MERTEIISAILRKNGINSESPVRTFPCGFVNDVYEVNDALVLKIEKDLRVVSHQPELVSLARSAGVMAPRIMDAGSIDGVGYLLMEKLPGRRLSEDWLTMTSVQRDVLVGEICDQLKRLHGISFSSYSIPRPIQHASWKDALRAYTDLESVESTGADDATRANLRLLRDWYAENERILDQSGPPVLVHNDIHFDNMLHVNGRLSGILDFDFARQAPREYELWHLVDFFQCPRYYVGEAQEAAWTSFVHTNEIASFKRHYPELFEVDRLAQRIRLYLTENVVDPLRNGYPKKFNEKMEIYFHTRWLESAFGTED